MPYPLILTPEYRDYVWGGTRLRPGQRTAEAWVIYEQNLITNGDLAGRTLLEAVQAFGPELLGERVFDRTGRRFPLLVKLLDCADWLSLQVHPNDEQARRLEGPDQFGKTEAWHILEADPGARLLFGLRPGMTLEELQAAVTGGTILDQVQSHQVQRGDTVFIRPGMIHALGPGLLIYEVQQTSNITYRVFDWNRPAAAGRKLHIEESLEVLDPDAEARIVPRPQVPDGERVELAASHYFTLELLHAENEPVALDTQGETFHALTVTAGQARVQGSDWAVTLNPLESLVVSANSGAYQVVPLGDMHALKASVE